MAVQLVVSAWVKAGNTRNRTKRTGVKWHLLVFITISFLKWEWFNSGKFYQLKDNKTNKCLEEIREGPIISIFVTVNVICVRDAP